MYSGHQCLLSWLAGWGPELWKQPWGVSCSKRARGLYPSRSSSYSHPAERQAKAASAGCETQRRVMEGWEFVTAGAEGQPAKGPLLSRLASPHLGHAETNRRALLPAHSRKGAVVAQPLRSLG